MPPIGPWTFQLNLGANVGAALAAERRRGLGVRLAPFSHWWTITFAARKARRPHPRQRPRKKLERALIQINHRKGDGLGVRFRMRCRWAGAG